MGAILKLKRMPSNCRECCFARKNERGEWICVIRGTRIIAYEYRDIKMPLCYLENEGEFIVRLMKENNLKGVWKRLIKGGENHD